MGLRKQTNGDSSPPRRRQSAPEIDPEQAMRSSAKRMAAGRNEVSDGGSVSPDERVRRISEAAYYRAERRGFTGGYEVEDWIAAEREIDQEGSRSQSD